MPKLLASEESELFHIARLLIWSHHHLTSLVFVSVPPRPEYGLSKPAPSYLPLSLSASLADALDKFPRDQYYSEASS